MEYRCCDTLFILPTSFVNIVCRPMIHTTWTPLKLPDAAHLADFYQQIVVTPCTIASWVTNNYDKLLHARYVRQCSAHVYTIVLLSQYSLFNSRSFSFEDTLLLSAFQFHQCHQPTADKSSDHYLTNTHSQ